MSSKELKICFIAAAGGHFEQVKQLKAVTEKYNYYYVLNYTDSTKKLKEKKYLVSAPEDNNKLIFFFQTFSSIFKQIAVFMSQNPDAIITTGAGFVIPTCILGKIFGKKVIYIETFAKVEKPSKTGVFIYKYKIADLFLVQHKKSLEYFPKATYGGWIY